MKKAFSLVELSIVLVILGLLVGGVLSGQSLIRASELRSVIAQYNGYFSAVNTFRDKYFALPGDMTNATSFWGQAAVGAACYTTASGNLTCNGNGDGNVTETYANSNELYRFWQQLALAGLIEGNYTGTSASVALYNSSTANSPVGRLGSSLWATYNYGILSGQTYAFDGNYGNTLLFGTIIPGSIPANPIFKPEDLWNIDTKMDDGKPATGKVVVRTAGVLNTCTDATLGSTLTASYLLSNSALTCAIYFRQAF